MVTPNAVIVGMPKCSTTSLFSYLAAHPQVCPSTVKETYFLMDENHPLHRAEANLSSHGEAGYGRFFPSCGPGPIRLESTPDYFYQKTAFAYLTTKRPAPKVIFILREPAARVYSLFRFAKNNVATLPRELRFSEFVEQVREGMAFTNRPILAGAISHSHYYQNVKVWVDALGRKQVFLMTLEALQADPYRAMSNLAAFLDIDPVLYHRFDFRVRNRSLSIRSQTVQRLKRSLFRRAGDSWAPTFLRELYRKLNTTRSEHLPSADDLATLAELRADFASDKSRLAEYDLGVGLWG